MQEALLYERQEDQVVLCRLCPWDCQIAPGELGRCQVRQNHDGTLLPLNYGLISAAAVEPVERPGLYHLFPGCMILSLGSWGENLSCRHRPCPPQLPAEGEGRRLLEAERAVNFAVERRCRGLAWGYQEPVVWLEYVLDSAKLARANGLFTLLMTKGFIGTEALDLLGPYLNAYAVEILAASAQVYESVCALSQGEVILERTVHVRERWRSHIEVRTPIIPGINDQDEVLRGLAVWIRDALSPDTPWHVYRFSPAGEMEDHGPTPTEVLEQAQNVGREAGLRYVYIQTGEEAGLTSTFCPSCGDLLIRRQGQYAVKTVGLDGNKCARCGSEIYLRRSIFD